MNLTGRNILVTGGGGIGVGAGICEAITQLGGRLFLNEITMEKAKAAVSKYPSAIPVAADVGDMEAITEMFRSINDTYGTIDGLVNNAGIGLTKLAHDADLVEFERLYQVDIQGVWQMSKAFVSQLIAGKKTGNIVNVSSVHAHATAPRYAIYSSAKCAVEGLTRGMAVELGPQNIRVNAIAPGYVHAEQNYDLILAWTDDPKGWVDDHTQDHQVLRHMIPPIDCGYAAVFLLSDFSKSITGQTLHVNNGMTLSLYNNQFME